MVATSSSNAISPDGIRVLGGWPRLLAGSEVPCQHPLASDVTFAAVRGPMLAMDFIKSNRADVERAIRDKGVDLDLDALLALEAEARALKTEIDNLRAERNRISDCFK